MFTLNEIEKRTPYNLNSRDTFLSNPVNFPELLEFGDRDSYLAWVAEWKKLYVEFTLTQRELKKVARNPETTDAGWQTHVVIMRKRVAQYLLALRHYGKAQSAKIRSEAVVV